jgi:hypothetical protein
VIVRIKVRNDNAAGLYGVGIWQSNSQIKRDDKYDKKHQSPFCVLIFEPA